MKLSFKIALRFLTSSKGQTLLIALGIAVGVSVQIFIGSLIQGLQKSLIDKTIGNSPQITVTSTSDSRIIDDYILYRDRVDLSDNGIINVSVTADGPALIKSDNKTYSVLIRGMEFSNSDKIYDIKEKIYSGREAQNPYEAILGKELQEELGADLGNKINIVTSTGTVKELTITGFYNLRVASINKAWIITDLKTSQEIFSLGEGITSIEMQVKDIFKAEQTASILKDNLGGDFKVENWQAQNAELLSGLKGQSTSSLMIQVFVLVSVVLGIASVLAITVLQKSKQIGILKAMGIKDRDASLIFLFQGLLLGILGSVLGVVFGLGLAFLFTKFALNPDGTPVVELYIDYGFIAASALIALMSASVAALMPARRSSKLNPIEVIRNG